jgi:hypothetical protein
VSMLSMLVFIVEFGASVVIVVVIVVVRWGYWWG